MEKLGKNLQVAVAAHPIFKCSSHSCYDICCDVKGGLTENNVHINQAIVLKGISMVQVSHWQ